MTLLETKQPLAALAAFDAALLEESDCAFAHFQRAMALGDLGRIDEAIAAYEQAYALRGPRLTNVPIEAAINLGLMYAHLDDVARSNLWLTRAILADPRADPHRNLLYSFSKPRGRDRTIELLIGGQPIFLQPTDPDWRQTTLFQYVPTDAGLRLRAVLLGRRE